MKNCNNTLKIKENIIVIFVYVNDNEFFFNKQ